MSAETEIPEGDRDLLAAEYMLGLLEGEALAEASALEADPAFAALIERWQERLAPMLAALPEEQPPAALWPAIAAQVRADNVVALKPRNNIWKGYSAVMTAIAASLAVALVLESDAPAPMPAPAPKAETPTPSPTLVAMLESADNPARLVVSWDPGSRSFLVTPAVLSEQTGRQHELWLIPPSGTPRSLGLVGTDGAQRIVIPVELLRDLSDNASIALSIEPEGGSPTGLPTGPVIASGALQTI